MKRYDFKQYSREWWAARRGIPTASQFHRICTPVEGEYSKQADKYVCELIAELADPEYAVFEDYQSDAMKAGVQIEPEARAFYAFERDAEVDQVGFCTTEDGRWGSSPDGLVGDDGCIEIKSPLHKTQVEYLLAGVVPNAYKPQVHGHLIVTGRAWCDFLSYASGLPHLLVRVEPDAYTDKLRACLEHFSDQLAAAMGKIDLLGGIQRPAVREPEREPKRELEDEIVFF